MPNSGSLTSFGVKSSRDAGGFMTSVGEFANNPGAGSYEVAPALSPIVPRHKQRLLRKGGGRVSGA